MKLSETKNDENDMNAARSTTPHAALLPPHPAFAESATHLTEMLRGFVIRWETLDLASSNCLAVDAGMRARLAADAEELLPAAYQRQ
jgi:hypothetical protein